MRAHGGSDIRDVNVNSDRWAVVKAALVAGMYPQVISVHQGATPLSSHKAKKICFHPTSVLSRSQSKQVLLICVAFLSGNDSNSKYYMCCMIAVGQI